MKRSVPKEENQTKQEDNIYNHKRKKKQKKKTVQLIGWSHFYFPTIFFPLTILCDGGG